MHQNYLPPVLHQCHCRHQQHNRHFLHHRRHQQHHHYNFLHHRCVCHQLHKQKPLLLQKSCRLKCTRTSMFSVYPWLTESSQEMDQLFCDLCIQAGERNAFTTCHHQTQSGSCMWQTDWTAEWAWRQRKGIQWPTKQLQRPQLSSLWRSQCQSLHHHEGFLSGDLDWQHRQPFSTGWRDHPQRAWRHFWCENVSIPKPSTTCHCYIGNHPWTVFSWWHGQSADWTKQNTTSFFRV